MSLNRLLEMQKAAKAKADAASDGTDSKTPVAGSPSVASQPVTQGPQVESMTPDKPAVPAPKRLPFANNKPKAAAPKPAPTPKPEAKPKEALSLDNLASFDLSDLEEPAESNDAGEFAGFHDEIEATAPDRDLPDEMDPQSRGFVESLDSIYTILNDSDMFGQQIRQIMLELQENPEYEKLISDTDVHVMIRAMRNTMGLARVRKQAKSRKSGTTTKSRAPSKKQALMDKALALSVGMDFEP